MKLSKAQTEVMEKAKARIDFARTHDFYDWFRNIWSFHPEKANWSNEQIDAYYEDMDKRFNNSNITFKDEDMAEFTDFINGIDSSCHTNSKTLEKLEEMGLIEIIYDSKGDRFGIDKIRILNY